MPHPRFTNPWPHETHGLVDILKWKTGLGTQEISEIPGAGDQPPRWKRVLPAEIARVPDVGWRIVWLSHASFLVQGCGLSLLIDPMLSDCCAPVPIASLRRKVAVPCEIADLPEIDAVLLTHSHYDHLDLSTLKALQGNPRIVIAEGHAGWLSKKLGTPVAELPWHDTLPLNRHVRLTATPAQHFTARTPFDRNRGHWCGWLLEGGGCKVWHAGDSGYCPAFREIGERYGPIDFGMIPIGAYQPRSIMKPMHMNPEEAVRAFEESRCRRAVAMHWGTFDLTDEPMGEPPLRLRRELERKQLPADAFTAEAVGSQWEVMPPLI